MEGLLSLIAAIVVIALVRAGVRALGAGAQAALDTATGKGTFGENLDVSLNGMQAMETRLQREEVTGEHPFVAYHVEARGLFPVVSKRPLAFRASIVDVTELDDEGKPISQPVLCTVERFQEPDTIAYADTADIGVVEPDYGWKRWLPILHFIPETLVPPRHGTRNYKVVIRAYDPSGDFEVRLGFVEEGRALASWVHDFTWEFEGDGYRETSEKNRLAEEDTIRLAVAMAFADGDLQDVEGEVIKAWMQDRLELVSGDDRGARKTRFNAVLRKAFEDGRSGKLELGHTVEQLKSHASPSARTIALELCLDVMSADGKAGDDEMAVVNMLAKRLDVDLERFEGLKDKRLVGLASRIGGDVDYHALLNMDAGWSQAQIRTHLNKLYSQWNSRAEALTDPEQRAQAEHMREVIARARQALLE